VNRLIEKTDKLIAGIGKLGRREAFESVQEVFGLIQQRRTLSEPELKRFMDLVTLVLLVYPRGMRIRLSGARPGANAREERLDFNDNYEAALSRTIDFLARNFSTHVEEYTPLQYLRAALRELAKEYGRARTIQNESIEVDSISERVALDDEGGGEARTNEPRPEAFSQLSTPVPSPGYEYVLEYKPDGEIFYDWFVGNLSRRELAQLRHLSPEEVDQSILHIARSEFEHGRLYPLINSLVHLKVNGDILWLALKGLTGEQIGQKVALSHWAVYKRLGTMHRRFRRLRALGASGRAFGEWLCGVRPELGQTAEVRRILHEHGAEFGLEESLS
jgi:hypothetical protein